jgi:MFS family permease
MLQAISTAWALFLGLGLIMLGAGLQSGLLGVRAEIENFSGSATGIIMAGYFVGFLLGSRLTPLLVRRVGHVRVFAALASLASTAVLIYALIVDPVAWTVMRIITGFCYAGLYIVAESWLNERADNTTRGTILSVYMVVVFVGMAGGQYLLNAADPAGAVLFIVSSIVVSLALIPILLSAGPAPSFEKTEAISLKALYRASPLGVVGAVATGMAQGTIFSLTAVYAARIGLPISQIAVFTSLVYVGAMLLQLPLGRLSDHLDRRRVLTGTAFAAASLGLAFYLLEDASLWVLFLLIALFGGLVSSMYALVISHTNDHLSQEQMVAGSSTLYLVYAVGATGGPLLGGVIMDVLHPSALFLFLAAVLGALGTFALWRMTRRASLPMDEQGEFQAVPSTYSPLATELAAEAAADAAELSEEEEAAPAAAG